jgi:translocation and assembly module TamA
VVCVCLFVAGTASAQLEYVVKGVDDPLRDNILSHVDVVQFGQRSSLSQKDADKVADQAEDRARVALRPYGYYQPQISTRVIRHPDRPPVVELSVDRGPPIIIREMRFDVTGPGSGQREVKEWRDRWPFRQGDILDQTVWEQQKQEGLEAARAQGYLAAAYSTHSLELDLEQNSAKIQLVLDTGPRYVFGDIDYGEHVLRPGIVEGIPRFGKGNYYTAVLMDRFRMDLWRTGWFTDIEVREIVRDDQDPPVVDLALNLETDKRSYYQGALGFGSDTGIRLNGQWSRHPMSSRGDRVDVGVGWRNVDDEYAIRGTYRIPRKNKVRQFWTTDLVLKFENQDLEVKREEEDEDFIKLANGNIDEQHIRMGRLKIRNRSGGYQQLFENIFVQYLRSQRAFEPIVSPVLSINAVTDSGFDRLLNGLDNVWSVGLDLDRVGIQGKEFATRGHRDRAWAFTSVNAGEAEVDFWQIYLSTRRSYVYGDRWKFIVRAELGYSDAFVEEVFLNPGGQELALSVTRLPNFYRFKAGGSTSVRGYGFEQLSNNNMGSNNIATASAEIEFKVFNKWAGAVFFDIGNAFNDVKDADLKRGVGIGFRWYSIAGPIRVDFARAIDFEGKPWRLHFSIGTPLL